MVGAAAGEYEQILHVALLLFHERGYRETGMEDIASEVNMPTSSLYKYFSGKSAILAAIYRRAADRVSGDASTILAATDKSAEAITQLVDAYVHRSFANPELAYLYYVERGNVPAPDRNVIHNIQRATIEAWVRQVTAARPDIAEGEARFAVHAAFVLVGISADSCETSARKPPVRSYVTFSGRRCSATAASRAFPLRVSDLWWSRTRNGSGPMHLLPVSPHPRENEG